MTRRGRPRKYTWFSSTALENSFSPEAQYLKWASANNIALQTIAASGCPRCNSDNVEFRHDKKYHIIRFHCIECRHETSYRIKVPKPGSYTIIPLFKHGVQVGEKIVDYYHPTTKHQRSDILVLRASRGIESGKISLGGEWCINMVAGGLHDQKRYYDSFEEALQICSRNRMQADHEKRLRDLEAEHGI
jgi:transposase-like protein